MDIENMSAEQRKEELARLTEATRAAKAEAKVTKTEAAKLTAAVKAAATPEEKASLKERLTETAEAVRALSARVEECVVAEAEFRNKIDTLDKAVKKSAMEKRQEAAKAARKSDPIKALAEKYAKAYPDCKAFHITSDRQVFLDKDKGLAQLHQQSLGEGEVQTINIR